MIDNLYIITIIAILNIVVINTSDIFAIYFILLNVGTDVHYYYIITCLCSSIFDILVIYLVKVKQKTIRYSESCIISLIFNILTGVIFITFIIYI